MQLFGLEITLGKKDKEKSNILSVVPPAADDGSAIMSSINAGSYYGMVLDVEGVIKNENDLIRRYREVAQYPDCDSAIEDIINEAIMAEDGKQPVEIILDDLKLSESIKKKIVEEFKIVLQLLKIDERGHDMFRTWYVDGRLYYHVMIDENNIKDGIVEMRAIDPRKIRRIKNVIRERQPGTNVEVVKKIDEYYLFNDKGITEQTTAGVKLSLDSVVYTPSGLVDANTGMMLSFLHKAIKPVNQLKLIEDSLVIYRVSRAPERRIFYIDVGNLPKVKAEQYVNDIMNRFRNKVVYDASTGETRDDRKFMSMLEDFWMPRREGGKGTEITTLPGGQNLGQIDDIVYFQNKLFQALNVPIGRLKPEQVFSLGKSSEITREEVKFSKFIGRLRKRFSTLFKDTLRVQLVSKGIIRPDEWDDMRSIIRFDFVKDNYFSELKDNEVLMQRINMLQQVDPYVGKYYSTAWIRKHVLQQSEEDVKDIDTEMKDEQAVLAANTATPEEIPQEQQGEVK